MRMQSVLPRFAAEHGNQRTLARLVCGFLRRRRCRRHRRLDRSRGSFVRCGRRARRTSAGARTVGTAVRAAAGAAHRSALAAYRLYDPLDGRFLDFDRSLDELRPSAHGRTSRLTHGAAMFATLAIFTAGVADNTARARHAEVFANAAVDELRLLLHVADRLANLLHMMTTAAWAAAAAGLSVGGEARGEQENERKNAKHCGIPFQSNTAERMQTWRGGVRLPAGSRPQFRAWHTATTRYFIEWPRRRATEF